jgi:Gas vesicle synthesis protein GvpL/GvpF
MALVVYGVMRAGDCPDGLSVDWRGATLQVDAISQDSVSALVGDAPDGPVRVRRNALLAHSEVLHAAMELGPVLPLRFGVVLADEAAVRDELLAPNAAALAARLEALEGTAEFQLKVSFDSERVLSSILASEGPLADIAARVRALPGAAGHFDRIRLGELISQRIESRAASVEAELIGALEPLAISVSRAERHDEWMALNAAFLVDDAKRSEFDAAIDRVAAEHAGDLQFRVIGPLPPHSFADHAWEARVVWA